MRQRDLRSRDEFPVRLGRDCWPPGHAVGRLTSVRRHSLRNAGLAAGALVVVLSGAAWLLSAWVASQGPPEPATVNPWVGSVAVAWAVTGAVLVRLRPGNSVGWLLLGVAAVQAFSVGSVAYGGYGTTVATPAWPAAGEVAQAGVMAWFPSMVVPMTVLPALYPSGRLPARWWRWPVGAVSVTVGALTIVASLDPKAYDDVATGRAPLSLTPGWWSSPVFVGALAAGLAVAAAVIWVATGLRLRRAHAPERQQLAWLMAVAVLLFVGVFLVRQQWAAGVAAHLLPVAVAVGVLRYRLLGIVASSGLVYGALTLAVLALYVAVAGLLGSAALDVTPEQVPGTITAAVVAVTVTPAQRRLQRIADRFVYGERRDPVGAVTRLGAQVMDSEEAELLPVVLSSLQAALHVPAVTVTAPTGQVLAAVGEPDPGPPVVERLVPLRVGGRDVGALHLAARRPGEPLTPGDERLLAALAPQVAVVVRALALTEALHRERDQVVVARHSERDRLRRDLHDGLGPALAGVSLGLQAAHDVVPPDGPGPALLARLREEVDATLAEVRRVIDDLRPARLDDLGLVAAVRRHADTVASTLPVQVDAYDLPPLPPEVEAAAFRITQEALTNAARHSGARQAQVTLAVEGQRLVVAVADDGHGLDAATAPVPVPRRGGVGLGSMRYRAERLGGRFEVTSDRSGTRVEAALPLVGG